MPAESLWAELFGNRGVSSLLLIGAAVAIRFAAARLIRGRSVILSDDRREWLARIRNISVLLVTIDLILIWLPSLDAFVLSIAAFAVALVIATKELILCLSGTLLRVINQPFEIGDWVEIGTLRGEVVDETMLATTLQEIGGPVGRYEYSGKTMVVPNSIFLSTPVQNQSFFKTWIFLEVFTVLESDVDMVKALPALEKEIEALFAPHAKSAEASHEAIKRRSGINIAAPHPRFTISTTDIGKQRIGVKLFCPTRNAFELERAINSTVLRHYWDHRGSPTQPAD